MLVAGGKQMHTLQAIAVAGLVIVVGIDLGARPMASQTSPLSGAWTEVSAPGSGRSAWGSRFTSRHDTERFTVIGPDGMRSYALDGTTMETALAWSPCSSTLRRTHAEDRNGQIVITESIVTNPNGSRRAHGSPCLMIDDEQQPGPSGYSVVRPTVALDTVTVVSRKSDQLLIEVTRRGPSGSVTTTSVYKPDSK